MLTEKQYSIHSISMVPKFNVACDYRQTFQLAIVCVLLTLALICLVLEDVY